jgi:ParB/RepB/Spo0J family partition protein
LTASLKPKLVQNDSQTPTVYPSVHVALGLIAPSPTNRRVEASDELIASIKEDGVTSDILVRPVLATEAHVVLAGPQAKFSAGQQVYEIVFGERRYRGSMAIGLETVPAKIRELSDMEALRLQIDENEQRENLSPMDRAAAYEHLRKQFIRDHEGERGYTDSKCIQDIAGDRGVEARTVYQVLALNKLELFVQHALRNGEMEASHGYEIARLEGPQQLQVLAWLRKETQHSMGAVPSVRRLKREISAFQIAWDEKKRQASLPLDGDGDEAQTSAEEQKPAGKFEVYEKSERKEAPKTKPQNAAQIKKQEEEVAQEIAANLKRQREAERARKTEKTYRGLFFTALASKVTINSRFLSHVVPALLLELWDNGNVPFEPFCQNFLGWPAPKNSWGYEHDEVLALSKRHTRKFTSKLLAALIITLNLDAIDEQRVAKYNGVDPKKLYAKAKVAVKEEERQAKLPKVPTTQREKQLHYAVHGDDKKWNKIRRLGASDAELKDGLGKMWGEHQGFGSKEFGHIECKGGKDPSIVFDFKRDDVLRGSALIEQVRDLLRIPEKKAA